MIFGKIFDRLTWTYTDLQGLTRSSYRELYTESVLVLKSSDFFGSFKWLQVASVVLLFGL